jgi:hypothetical protein
MNMTRKPHPEYHKMMMDPASHPTATRRPKHEETRSSHLYKTGTEVLKIRKTSTTYANVAINEAYAQEALQLGRRWAPTAYLGVVPICRQDGGFGLGGIGAPVEYALRMVQLSDHYFVDYLVEHKKLNATAIGRIARFLAQKHGEGTVPEAQAAEAGRAEHFGELAEEVLYQSKKYLGVGLTPAMYELIARPMNHFLEHHRKVFLRRLKKNRVVQVHGAFWPQHVYVKHQEVEAIAPLESPRKLRVLDAVSDVAQFVSGLRMLGAAEDAATFIERYAAAAKDRDMDAILPAYQVYQATREGLICCEWLAELPEDDTRRNAIRAEAMKHYELAVEIARQLPK